MQPVNCAYWHTVLSKGFKDLYTVETRLSGPKETSAILDN